LEELTLPCVVPNVLRLGEEADFEERNCPLAQNLIQGRKLHLSAEPPFLPNGG